MFQNEKQRDQRNKNQIFCFFFFISTEKEEEENEMKSTQQNIELNIEIVRKKSNEKREIHGTHTHFLVIAMQSLIDTKR